MPWSKTKVRSPEEIARIKAIRAAAKKRYRSNPKNQETELRYRQSESAKEKSRFCYLRLKADPVRLTKHKERQAAYARSPNGKACQERWRNSDCGKSWNQEFQKTWHQANKERKYARFKERLLIEPGFREKCREWNRRFKASPKRKAYDREYALRPDVRARERARMLRDLKDPVKAERSRVWNRRWCKSKRGREWHREKDRRRRAQKLGRTTESQIRLILEWERKWRRKKKVTCYWCRIEHPPKECHMDHVVALVKGGSHTIGNVCISCMPCNVRKQAKTLEQWNGHLEQPALL